MILSIYFPNESFIPNIGNVAIYIIFNWIFKLIWTSNKSPNLNSNRNIRHDQRQA